ncbi:DNA topoisomerase IB [Novosphingobium sp. BL-8H]|uniref:DNA topoisomerase IB n=1 Tax=Novosphingobium sp. BL-8H TaxID=3127640 RepID=UPI003757274E
MPRLRFADPDGPGITRSRTRAGKWAYHGPDGTRITDRDEIDRLNRIALPPAYVDCWFSPLAEVHLLATGFDARGRKQYRYHPEWRAGRDARKFDRCAPFGHALPALRERVARDLAGSGLCRDRAVASIVALLDAEAIRIGNERYAAANKSFGATTLRNRHAKLQGRKLHLRFRGKHGKLREVISSDRALVSCVRRMQDLPGQHLFQYLDDEGCAAPVGSQDVNAYLHETMGEEFSAKDFRTFAASTIGFARLWEQPGSSLKTMLEEVAERLGNTPAIARKSYVHPALIAFVRKADPVPELPARLPRRTQWLTREERGLIAFLEASPPAATWG